MWRLARSTYFVIASLIGGLIVIKAVDYLNPDFTQGFLLGKKEIFSFYKLFLYAHIIGAPIALLCGIFQFSFRRSNYHRPAGYIYVGAILLLAGPGGIGMSFYALGGTLNVLNFLLLSSLWMLFTSVAFYFARKQDFSRHRKMMTRSFILTNSAILIRLFSYVNYQYDFLPEAYAYTIISISSWVPFLIIYEVYTHFILSRN